MIFKIHVPDVPDDQVERTHAIHKGKQDLEDVLAMQEQVTEAVHRVDSIVLKAKFWVTNQEPL